MWTFCRHQIWFVTFLVFSHVNNPNLLLFYDGIPFAHMCAPLAYICSASQWGAAILAYPVVQRFSSERGNKFNLCCWGGQETIADAGLRTLTDMCRI